MSSIRLPPELIDRAIDHLHDSPLDLRHCALVCKAWLVSCRFHIFRQIDILSTFRQISLPSLKRLYGAIQRSPDIAFCIRNLFIFVGSEEWSSLETILPQLLNSFTSLKAFALEGIIWSDLPPPIRKAFCAVFALPSIIDVTLISMEFGKVDHFTDLIHTPLKQLYLQDVSFHTCHVETMRAIDKENEGLRSPGRRPCQLEDLRLDLPGSELVDWLLGEQSIIDLSAIHTFDTMPNPKADNTTSRIMRRLGLSLKHFIIQDHSMANRYGPIIEDTIDFTRNPNIETLYFVCKPHPNLPRYLATCLSRLPAGKLREITINPAGNSVECPWSELDDFLSSQLFETLQKVNFIRGYGVKEDDYQKILDQLPSLVSRGILHVIY